MTKLLCGTNELGDCLRCGDPPEHIRCFERGCVTSAAVPSRDPSAQMRGLCEANRRAAKKRSEQEGGSPRTVVRGAPSHTLAYLLNALEEDGWVLHRPCPGCCNCAPSNFTDPMCNGSGDRGA